MFRSRCAKAAKLKSSQRGFTLVELMTVVAIVGLLAALAVGNFGNFTWSQRLNEVAREFYTASTIARSEALRRGRGAVVQLLLADDAGSATDIRVVSFLDDGDFLFDPALDELLYEYRFNQFALSSYLTFGTPSVTYAEQLVFDDGGTMVTERETGATIPPSILFNSQGFSYEFGATSGEQILNGVRVEISDPVNIDSGVADKTLARVLEVTVAGAARLRVEEIDVP